MRMDHYAALSTRVLSGLIAFAIALAASTASNLSALAQSKGKPTGSTSAHADGKLTIDGKATQLKYVYARKDWPSSPLIDLILTNEPLPDDAIPSIVALKYHGSGKLKGLWLVLDSKTRYKPPQLLIDSGEVPSTGGVMEMMTGKDVATIENGRIKGKLECRINTPARTTSFVFSFDAPLVIAASEPAAATSPEQFRKDFERTIRGKWSIESWRSASGQSYSGSMTVNQQLPGGKYQGTIHIVYGKDNSRKVDEEVIISRDGMNVRMDGSVAPGTRWSPDIFTLELRGDLLVGGARDAQERIDGSSDQNVVLRKAAEDPGAKPAGKPAGKPSKSHAASPPPAAARDDLALQHDWKVVQGDDAINYASNHPAPVPFSTTGEPEALLAMDKVPISGKPRSLSEVVNSEIKDIRKGLLIGDYLEDDGHKPQNGIASWAEDIDGQQVAFIKYRAIGVKGEGRTMPRTAQHAIFIRNGNLYFVHLTVLFAGHQDEVRGDQIRLVKSVIRK